MASHPHLATRRGCLLPATSFVLDEVDAACLDACRSTSACFIQQPEVITVISLFLLGYYEDVNEMAFSKTAET